MSHFCVSEFGSGSLWVVCPLKEKVHYTTLICSRCLSLNPQPQNQTLDTYKLLKLSNLSPSGLVGGVFANVAPHVR
jgi:hypothetical protein